MEDRKQYFYLGDTLDFKDFRFTKGVTYFENDLIKKRQSNGCLFYFKKTGKI